MNQNKKNIYLMYAIAFLQGIVIYATISTLYREQRGLNLSDYAILESFSYFFTLAFEIPFGFLADRIGYKKTLVLSNGIYFLSKVVFWKAYGFPMFLLERFLLSIAFAGISGVDTSILYLSSKEGESQKNFGYYAAFGTAGMLTGSIIFTLFLSQNYSGCAFGTMLAYGLAFLLTMLLTEVKGKTDDEEKITVSNLTNIIRITLKDVRFLGFLLGTTLINNATWLISVMLNQDKYLQVGLNEQQMGIIAIVISVAGLFSVSSAFFTKKMGVTRFVSAICVIMGIAAIAMGYTHIAIVAIACNFAVDFGFGLITPLLNELENERVTVADRATQLSVYGMICDVSAILLSVIVSRVAAVSYTGIFILVAIELAAAVIFVRICYNGDGGTILR